jgi:hypothetical protein
MKTLEMNRMECIEGGAPNAALCAGGIIVVAALGFAAFINPIGFATLALTPGANSSLIGATALGVTAIAEGC